MGSSQHRGHRGEGSDLDFEGESGLHDGRVARDTGFMRTYGQYCPIARGAEIFAERWTPLIIRNLHLGCETFGEILGAPGLSHTMLIQRLKQLERLGIVESAPASRTRPPLPPHELGPRSVQGLRDPRRVGSSLARDRPREPRSVRGVVVDVQRVRRDRLPDQRVVIRFDFTASGPTSGTGCCSSSARPRSARPTPVSTKTSTSPPTPKRS